MCFKRKRSGAPYLKYKECRFCCFDVRRHSARVCVDLREYRGENCSARSFAPDGLWLPG
ncbi:MAG: hypothetical protein QOC99_2261 [Acidobacteriota bacterium]|jgi:hypothetical protein|nr:hypothetical protein [Acidobacteriota bacterium]